MAASGASPMFGATLEISGLGDASYTSLGEIKSLAPPGGTSPAIDVTHTASDDSAREYIASGLVNYGEVTGTLNYVITTADTLIGNVGVKSDFKITFNDFPDGTDSNWTFSGVLTSVEPEESDMEGAFSASFTIQVSGAVTFTDGS